MSSWNPTICAHATCKRVYKICITFRATTISGSRSDLNLEHGADISEIPRLCKDKFDNEQLLKFVIIFLHRDRRHAKCYRSRVTLIVGVNSPRYYSRNSGIQRHEWTNR